MLKARRTDELVLSPWAPNGWVLTLTAALIAGLVLGVGLLAFPRILGPLPFVEPPPLEQYRYKLWKWETTTILDGLFARVGIGPNPGDAQAAEAIGRYFALTSEIAAASQAAQPDMARVDQLTAERAKYENSVERALERYISEAIGQAGLQERLPLFRGVAVTWPPPDLELTQPPRLLVRSPRNEIRRAGDTLLKTDLTLHQAESIEAQTDDGDTVSLVVSIGGLAAYPAIVNGDRSFDGTLETAAHEWVHQYLSFYPLGKTWGRGGDAEALNETTANIAGAQIAALIRQRTGLRLPAGADGRPPPGPAPSLDAGQELRRLRLEVDALLAQGKPQEAEALMETRRQYLAANGVYIRKINQAYFAFYGTYADSPASTNPIGPKIQRVWELTANVGVFLALMRDVQDVPALDRLLANLEAAAAGGSGR